MSRAYRILIVEDEEIELSALTMMLKYNRQDIQEIRTAVNGIQALDVYREFLPDIVFMDINLPGINGLDVIRQIRLLPGSPYFVIISAHSQFAYAQEAMRLDVQDFLVKPIRLEDINRVLDGLVQQINQSRSRKERAQYQQAKIDAIRPVLESDCVLSIASMRSNTPLPPFLTSCRSRWSPALSSPCGGRIAAALCCGRSSPACRIWGSAASAR